MSTPVEGAATRGSDGREEVTRALGFYLRELLPLGLFAASFVLLAYLLVWLPAGWAAEAEPRLAVRAILTSQLEQLQLRLWPLLGVAALLGAYTRLWRVRRIVRPVSRVHEAMQRLTEGEFRPPRLDTHDEFRFLEEDMMKVGQKMMQVGERNREILLAVSAQVEKLAERVNAGEVVTHSDLEEFVAALRHHLGKRLTPRWRAGGGSYATYSGGSAPVRNLSLRGIYIEDAQPLPEGAQFNLEVHLVSENLACQGVVRRSVPESGMAVQLLEAAREGGGGTPGG